SFAIRQRSTFLSKPTAAKLPRVWLSLALTALKYWSTSLWSRWPQAASANPRPVKTSRCRIRFLIVVLLSRRLSRAEVNPALALRPLPPREARPRPPRAPRGGPPTPGGLPPPAG